MKQFQISEQQMQQIANALAECPAKFVLPAIDILRNLKEISPLSETNNE
jgi:hypothetical protein